LAAWLVRKGAAVAAVHSIRIYSRQMLKAGFGCHELGGNCLEQIHKNQFQRYFVKRLQRFRLKVTGEAVLETT